jgi:(1->4)-alpha-D-glucan 1-alpha-D-glucosylmutase
MTWSDRTPFDDAAAPPPRGSGADALFDRTLAAIRDGAVRLPGATYRLQLNGAFPFARAETLADYFASLGVTHLYLSPILRSRPGSLHGYDVTAHDQLDPELGTRDDFDRLVAALHGRGLGVVLDFVPNHMGIGPDNAWWMDVLENGPSSLHAPAFDIDWEPLKAELRAKVLLPILGDHYGRVLERGELKLQLESGGFFLRYYDHVLPVNPRTYPLILAPLAPRLAATLGAEHDSVLELQSILTGLGHLPPRTESSRAKVMERRREKEILKRRLATLVAELPVAAALLASRLDELNGRAGEPRSFDELDALLEDQAYRLSFWRVAGEEINYRRFFDVNDLAAIRMEISDVFRRTHALVLELVGAGAIDGLRIDHPDGLWDPRGYLARLQEESFLALARARHPDLASFAGLEPRLRARLAEARRADPQGPAALPLYLVTEKILARGERLPESWPVHGTSGYDFAASVGGVFVDAQHGPAFTRLYERFVGGRVSFDDLVWRAKRLLLRTSLASELNVLAHALSRLAERHRHSRDFTLGSLAEALAEVIACFPVYRTYVTEDTTELDLHDRTAVERAVRVAAHRNPTTDPSVYRFLRAILLLEVPATVRAEDRPSWRAFVLKFQQLTSPVMAKGLEDTAFYAYNRLVSLNEVGGEPERFGTAPALFHRQNAERARHRPRSMLATSTHDTKRSEDVRARISVLSELPAEWEAALTRCSELAAPHERQVDGEQAPDPAEKCLIFQTILGTWPAPPPAGDAHAAWVERLVAYLRKATKEAKVHTSWVDATPEYDEAIERYLRAVLSPGSDVLAALAPLAELVAFHGRFAALAQVLLKLMSPGVPDLYQGTELWDLSLVDPDNRRPVDFERRAALLAELARDARQHGPGLARRLLEHAEDGRIKLFLTWRALQVRQARESACEPAGGYEAVDALGAASEHVLAFSRRGGGHEVVTVVPRLTARLARAQRAAPLGELWNDTRLPLREGRWRNELTGELLETSRSAHGDALPMSRVFACFPAALLVPAD